MNPNEARSALRVNSARMRDAFDRLAEIGATGDGGVHRPALSAAHLEARAWFRQRIADAGLEFRTDGAGNHSAVLHCGPPDAPALLLGSHLDSVPHGGRFDGALGVIAAFEVLRTIQDAGLELPFNLEAIDFTDEEGTLVGLLGSAALMGHLTKEDLRAPRGGRDALEKGLDRAGLAEAGLLSARRAAASLAGYLELHIEQGRRLASTGTNIGIVSAIVGISSYQLTFTGRADHAGTTSMEDRRDAGLGASAFTLAAREIVLRDFARCVVNVGEIVYMPGAFNIVPETARVSLEFRAPGTIEFRELENALLARARAEAERYGLEFAFEFLGKHEPTPLSELMQRTLAEAGEALGLTHMPVISGAGHDAQSLAPHTPAGMLFVPSVAGASHSPRERTEWQDCVNGTNVLLQAVLRFSP